MHDEKKEIYINEKEEIYINVKDLRIKIPKNKKKQEDGPKSPMTRFYDFFCNLFKNWFS